MTKEAQSLLNESNAEFRLGDREVQQSQTGGQSSIQGKKDQGAFYQPGFNTDVARDAKSQTIEGTDIQRQVHHP